MAVFFSFNFDKYAVLRFLDKRDINKFIDIGYFVTSSFFQIYIAYFIIFKRKNISNTLKMWKRYEAEISGEKSGSKTTTAWLPIVNGMITVIIVILKTVAVYGPFEDMVLYHSAGMAEGLFKWTPEQMVNGTSIDELYGEHLNATSYTMGAFGIITAFCWDISVDCFKDLIFWTAKVSEHHALSFGEKIGENLDRKSTTGKSSDEEDDRCWKMYRQLLEANMSTNSTFDTLLLFLHMDTFLTFSYFLTELLNDKATGIDMVVLGYDVLKGLIVYWPARKSSQEVRPLIIF